MPISGRAIKAMPDLLIAPADGLPAVRDRPDRSAAGHPVEADAANDSAERPAASVVTDDHFRLFYEFLRRRSSVRAMTSPSACRRGT